MGGKTYAIVLLACILFLGLRATAQLPDFDFDEPSHLQTVADIRKLGGLPSLDLFPEIVYSGPPADPAYHYLPPSPYLLLAGVSALAGAPPEPSGIRPVARILSFVAGVLTVALAGLAVRLLQRSDHGWGGAGIASAGLALMPGAHSMFASATADSFALLAIVAIVFVTGLGVTRNWPWRVTLAVGLVAAALFATRTTAYPTLLLPIAAVLGARSSLQSRAARVLVLVGTVLAINAWWMVRGAFLFGDPVGGMSHARYMFSSGFAAQASEFPLWRSSAIGAIPEISLLLTSPWFWVEQSRLLLTARSWIAPAVLAFWYTLVVIPTTVFGVVWTVRNWRREPAMAALLAAAALAALGAFLFELRISAQFGAFAVGRYAFMNTVPLALVTTALLLRRGRTMESLVTLSGLIFAGALSAAYMATVLK